MLRFCVFSLPIQFMKTIAIGPLKYPCHVKASPGKVKYLRNRNCGLNLNRKRKQLALQCTFEEHALSGQFSYATILRLPPLEATHKIYPLPTKENSFLKNVTNLKISLCWKKSCFHADYDICCGCNVKFHPFRLLTFPCCPFQHY